jgi:hypothetical protein
MVVIISELALIFQIIFSFLLIWFNLGWNLAKAAFYSGAALVNIFRNNPKKAIAFIFVTVFFILGVVAMVYQSEVMSSVDIVYESGIYPVVQFLQAFTYTLFRVSYEYVIVGWNAVGLYLRECVITAIDEIQLITDIGSLQGIVELATVIYTELKCWLSFPINVPEIYVPWLTDALRRYYDVYVSFADLFYELTVRLATFTLANSDCYFCTYDPMQKCLLRKTVVIASFTFPEATCANNCVNPETCDGCFDFITVFYNCVAKWVNLVFPITYIPGVHAKVFVICRAIACAVNGVVKPFLWIVVGLIDTALGGDCVKPDDLLSGPELIPDAFDALIECLNRLIIEMTSGFDTGIPALDNFFETVLYYFFYFVQEVVTTVNGFIDCHSSMEVSDCFDRWPVDGPIGPGYCQFQNGAVIPTNGIFQCFQTINVCLQNSTNLPLLNNDAIKLVIGFIYSNIWQYGLDFVVCPFAILPTCFENPPTSCPAAPPNPLIPGLSQIICEFVCIQDTIPLLSPIAEGIAQAFIFIDIAIIDIYDEIASILARTEGTFACLARCGIGGFLPPFKSLLCFSGLYDSVCRDRKRTIEEDFIFENMTESERNATAKKEWCQFLNQLNVSKETYCGSWLHSSIYTDVQSKWTDNMMYKTCFSLFVISNAVQQTFPRADTNANLLLNGEFIAYGNFFLRALKANSENRRHQNLNETYHKRDISVVNITQPGLYNGIKTFSTLFKRSDAKVPKNGPTGILWFVRSIYDYSENVGYSALNRQYIFDVRKVRSEYDNGLNSIENDESKPLVQRQSEIAELELIQNKVLRRMFNQHMTNLNQLRRNRHLVKFENNSASLTVYGKRGDPSLPSENCVISIQKDNHHLMQMLATPKTGVFRKRYTEDVEKQNLFVHEKTESIKEKAQQTYDRLLSQAPTVVHLHGEFQKRGYDLFSNRYFRWVHMFAKTSTGNASWSDLYDYSAGKKGYIPEQGFVSVEEEAENLGKRTLYKRGTILDLTIGNYTSKEKKKYGPFLTNHRSTSNGLRRSFPNGTQVTNLLRRTQYESRRTSLAIKRTGIVPFATRHANIRYNSTTKMVTEDFNFNTLFFEWFDAFFGTDFWQTFISKTIQLGNDFLLGLQDWTENFVDTLERYFTCNVPENIDGTLLYNPFCFPLLPEKLLTNVFTLASPNTSTAQISWPPELIKRPCVNTFNGNGNLFEIVFSDNCVNNCPAESQFSGSLFFQPDDENPCTTNPNQCCRPFCTSPVPTDYCSQDYYTCNDAGFSDALDTLFFALGAVGSFTKTIYQDTISYTSIDQVLVTVIFLVTTPLFLVSLIVAIIGLLPSFGVSVLLSVGSFVLMNFFLIAIEKLLVWTLSFIFLNGLPIPIIIISLGLITIFLIKYAGLKIPNLFLIIFVFYFVSFVILAIAELYVDEPINLADTIDPIGWLISLFTYIETSWFLSIFFPWAPEILARLQEYHFPPGSALPPLDIFCFFYSLDSSMLLVSLLFLAPFLGSLAYNTIGSFGLLLIDIWFFVFLVYDFINVYFLRRQVEDNEETMEELQQKVDSYQSRFFSTKPINNNIADETRYKDSYVINMTSHSDDEIDEIQRPKKLKQKRSTYVLSPFDFSKASKTSSKKD